MDIREFFSPTNVFVNFDAPDKARLLKDLCTRAAAVLNWNTEQVLEPILKREQLGSTGVGAGVAIPHARLQELARPIGVLARLKKPMDFQAIDEQPVDIVCLLLLPTDQDRDPLNVLAAVARKLRDPNVLRHIRRASDVAGLLSAVSMPKTDTNR
jgi:PTS system nitrogen regulatory IIA component